MGLKEQWKKGKRSIARGIKEARVRGQQRRAAERQIRKKSRAEYYREKEKQEIRYQRGKARIEASEKLRSFKRKTRARYTPPKGGGFGMIVGSPTGGIFGATPRKRTKRKKSKTKAEKAIVIGGKTYIQKTTKKKKKRRKSRPRNDWGFGI